MDNRIITKFDLQSKNESILNVNNIKNLKFLKNKDDTYNMYVEDDLFLQHLSMDDVYQIKSFIRNGSQYHDCHYTGYRGYRYLELLIQINGEKSKYIYFTHRVD
jgi:hypothetical protein